MNLDLKLDELAKLLGEKEITIFILRQRVAELEAKLAGPPVQIIPTPDNQAQLPKSEKVSNLRPA